MKRPMLFIVNIQRTLLHPIHFFGGAQMLIVSYVHVLSSWGKACDHLTLVKTGKILKVCLHTIFLVGVVKCLNLLVHFSSVQGMSSICFDRV